jgi:hypothetical protein
MNMKVKIHTLHAKADNAQSKTHGIQQTTTSDWKGVSLGLKPCAHIELLHTQLVAASSQNQNAQECTPNCLSHALHSVSNALLYPQPFLSLSGLHNLYTNPRERFCLLTKFLKLKL